MSIGNMLNALSMHVTTETLEFLNRGELAGVMEYRDSSHSE
jgi:hypothetical protein